MSEDTLQSERTIGERVIQLYFGISHDKLKEQLVESTSEQGSKTTFDNFLSTLDSYFEEAWFGKNRALLTIFDLEGLLGYDGHISDIIRELDDFKDFGQAKSQFASVLFPLIIEQLKNGAFTHFYEPEKLMNTAGAVLVDDIVQARTIEFLETVNHARKKDVRWSDDENTYRLGRSSIGFDILYNIVEYSNYTLVDPSLSNALDQIPEESKLSSPWEFEKREHSKEMNKIIQDLIELPHSHFSDEDPFDGLLISGFIDPLVAEEALNQRNDPFNSVLKLAGNDNLYITLLRRMAKSKSSRLTSLVHHLLIHNDYPRDETLHSIEPDDIEAIWYVQKDFLARLVKEDEEEALEFAQAIIGALTAINGYAGIYGANPDAFYNAICLLTEKGIQVKLSYNFIEYMNLWGERIQDEHFGVLYWEKQEIEELIRTGKIIIEK